MYICIYNSRTGHLKYICISILTNLLPTNNETKKVKTINYIQLEQLKKIKRTKSGLKRKML